MTDRAVSEQALSPSSSEIMRKATKLVDQLLIRTSGGFPSKVEASFGKRNDAFNSSATVMEEDINCGSNSITDSETLSVLTSAKKNTPSIDVIKRLAGRLKSKDSDTISELNFPSKIAVVGGQDAGGCCFQKPENCRSRSASPTSGEKVPRDDSGLSNDFAQMNERLSEINRRVESLSSNIEDIQDIDHLEEGGGRGGEPGGLGAEGGANPAADDGYLSQLNVAVLQQERLRMWARDNAKYSSSASSTSEGYTNQESEHIPFSDVYCTQQSLKYRSCELTSSSGVLNSSVLSTTVSGVNGQFAYSNDTTVYEEAKSGDRKCVSDFPRKLVTCIGTEYSENSNIPEAEAEADTRGRGDRPPEPKALRFIRVGSQLRRSITVTPLIESLQRALQSGDVGDADAFFDSHGVGSRMQFDSKLEKLSNSNVSTSNSSKLSPGYFANNTVIITLKDNGARPKILRRGEEEGGGGRRRRRTVLDDVSSVDSSESDRNNNFFSCRECSWNPASACSVQ